MPASAIRSAANLPRPLSFPYACFTLALVVAGTVIGGERALKNFEHHKYHAPAADAVTVAEPEAARPFVHYLATHRYHLIGAFPTRLPAPASLC